MILENLTEQQLVEIVQIYERHCGLGREFMRAIYQFPAKVLSDLKRHRSAEYRVGSRWDMNSKILFDSFRGEMLVHFNPNFDPQTNKRYREAEKAGREFVREVNEYLKSVDKR